MCLEYIKKMLSSQEDVSSKRLNGTVIIQNILLLVMIIVIFDLDIKPSHENLISTLFWGGVVLLGATGIEKLIKK